jgi:hypothetical protein
MEVTAHKAYSEILKTLKKYKDVCVFDIEDLERKSKCHLFGIELKENFGFNIDPKIINSCDWFDFGNYTSIGRWGEKHRRTISWPDNGKQPKDELLLRFSFPTGAYIFGEDYPVELFQKLFLEIKSYNPKYVDSHNSNIYFSMDNAGIIFNAFPVIMRKYNELNKYDRKQRQIQKLKDDLSKLEKS